jgi:hypothetical protein
MIALVCIFQKNTQQTLFAVLDPVKICDIPFVLEHHGNTFTNLGSSYFNLRLPGSPAVTNPRQHISYRVTQTHTNRSNAIIKTPANQSVRSILLPTRLFNTRNFALIGHSPEAYPAYLKLAVNRSASAANLTTSITSAPELRFLPGFILQCRR